MITRNFWVLWLALGAAVAGGQQLPIQTPTDLPQLSRFLPVDQAFKLEYGWQDKDTLALGWQIADDYYLYREQMKVESDGFVVPPKPAGVDKVDEFFGATEVYYQQVNLLLPVAQYAGDQLTLQLHWQGCAEAGLCYPPQKRTLTLYRPGFGGDSAGGMPAPQLSLAADEQIASQLAGGSIWYSLLLFLGFGLLLTFTPCVLPMVPILSGLLVGAGTISRPRAMALSGAYVLAMASTYAVAGVAAAASGASLQVAMQSPLVLIGFSAVIVALALSMFGLYDLQVPARLQTWLNSKSGGKRGGSLTGAATMGFLSALIVGPCVAPPLVGALLYIGQTGDMVLGGLALFSLGLGMGLPLMLFGAALGSLLPAAGAWMERIKLLFGFGLLGLAVWFIERLLSAPWQAAVWALFWLGLAVWLLLGCWRFWRQAAAASGQGNVAGRRIWLALQGAGGAASLLAAVLMTLAAVQARTADTVDLFDAQVRSLPQLQALLPQQSKPVMLDFYADWCIECKLMERHVLTDPQVSRALDAVVLVRADVTANDTAEVALMKHYGVLGPPTVLFFDSDGAEMRGLRLTGYADAATLLAHLQRVPKP